MTEYRCQFLIMFGLLMLLAAVIVGTCGCALENDMGLVKDVVLSTRADLTNHMQMLTRVEGAVVRQETNVQAGGNVSFNDIWLTVGFVVVMALVVIGGWLRSWWRRRNGHESPRVSAGDGSKKLDSEPRHALP